MLLFLFTDIMQNRSDKDIVLKLRNQNKKFAQKLAGWDSADR